MSAKLMGMVWDLDIPHPMAWVLMALADHADHDGGNLFAGQSLLAWKTGYSERQIRRILDQLEEAKIIIPDGGGVGRGMKQHYRIVMDNAPRKDESLKQKKRTKWPQSGTDNGSEKADTMAGYQTQESGQNGRLIQDKMAGLEEQKSGHPDAEKRTFSAGKADISNISHDKERAQHEPSVEPSVEPSEKKETATPLPPPVVPDPLALPEIDPLALAIANVMGQPRIPENGHGEPIFEAADHFRECGITPDDVKIFEKAWYARKIAAGKRYVLTLKILLSDLPVWKRAQDVEREIAAASAPVVLLPDRQPQNQFETKEQRNERNAGKVIGFFLENRSNGRDRQDNPEIVSGLLPAAT